MQRWPSLSWRRVGCDVKFVSFTCELLLNSESDKLCLALRKGLLSMATADKKNDKATRDRANVAAGRAKQMPESVQYAIVTILPNIVNGAFWGFTDKAGVEKHIEAIRQANGNISARLLGNACLIEANPNFLVKAVASIDPAAMTQGHIDNMREKKAEAEIAFEKFLISKGKTKQGQQPFGGTIGIYCINDVSTIAYKGVNYPAFRVDMQTALGMLGRYGYKISINGQFVDAMTAANAGQSLWSSTILSPTKTGLFINVQSTYTNDQIKQLEAQFKARYGIK